MALFAPPEPSIDSLDSIYRLPAAAVERIGETRAAISDVITRKLGFISIVGPCALTDNSEVITHEAEQMTSDPNNPFTTRLYRMPPWKPRTNPNDWHGLESEPSTVERAYELITQAASQSANVAIELGCADHIARYGERTSFGWIGARSIGDLSLLENVALKLPDLPIGIKHGLDGKIDEAIQNIARIAELRGDSGAPAVLIFRGGTNTRSPSEWEKQYLNALERTEGRLIVDSAHGSEMAFDPSGEFTKSRTGQQQCIDRIISLASHNDVVPLGIMTEASDTISPTDPVIDFDDAIRAVDRLTMIAYGKAWHE